MTCFNFNISYGILFLFCLGYTGTGCTTAAAWLTAGDHLRTGHGHAPDAYLILSLKIEKGFRAGRGTVSFTFQLDCDGDCQFVFMQVTHFLSPIESSCHFAPKFYFSFRFSSSRLVSSRRFSRRLELTSQGHFRHSDVERPSWQTAF